MWANVENDSQPKHQCQRHRHRRRHRVILEAWKSWQPKCWPIWTHEHKPTVSQHSARSSRATCGILSITKRLHWNLVFSKRCMIIWAVVHLQYRLRRRQSQYSTRMELQSLIRRSWIRWWLYNQHNLCQHLQRFNRLFNARQSSIRPDRHQRW